MTRDEAMDKLRAETDSACTIRWMEDFVDSAVALGMLKLDEPKSLDAQLAIALGWPEDGRSHGELTAALKMSGLKLIEA